MSRHNLPWGWTQTWRESEFCCLDIETTGLNPNVDSIVSYGIVPVSGGRIIASMARYGLVKPETEVSRESILIHAIAPRDLKDAPPLDDCLEEIVEMLDGRILVAHSAWVERSFLQQALRRRGRRLKISIVDTACLAKQCLTLPVLPDRTDISLEYAATQLGLPVHTPHHALGDAMTTAELFIVLASKLSAAHPCRTRTLTALSRR